ncbi:Est-6 [Trypoxylus dichotomus]
MTLTVFTFVLYLFTVGVNSDDTRPLVTIENGPILGDFRQSHNGRTYIAFEGIPYAEPPVGSLRFENPQPAKPWTDILDATRIYDCMQFIGDMTIGAEDCLYLNVYVPTEEINPEQNLDVIVHIHGGGFEVGNPGFMAAAGLIMDRDVVFVTMNYRLGVFGFYSTGNFVSNGNFGLKDQALSLKWIQDNIHRFGGNRDSVTITGLSAGGASVHLQYFSPISKGLFHKGFAQSGAALVPWAIRRDPEVNARVVAEAAGCPWEDIECLKERPAVQILSALPGGGGTTINFAPTIEPESPTSFLSEMPRSILPTERLSDVPLLLSVVTEDGTAFCDSLYGEFEYLDQYWNNIWPVLLEYSNHERQDEISQKIREFYLQDQPVTAENFGQIIKLCTDSAFHNGAVESAKLQGSVTSSGVYVLLMGYAGRALTNLGVGHGADGRFYYQNFPIGPPGLDEEEVKMKDILLDMLVSFARTGKPEVEGIDFEPVSKTGDFDYLFVSSPDNMTLRSGDELGEVEFWNSLGI